jgi:iron transport multicopper oxidase
MGSEAPSSFTDLKRAFHVDKEYVLTLSDLYHEEAPPLINYYQFADNYNNNGGAEPVPDSILINEAQGTSFSIIPGKTYYFRVINMGAMMPQFLQFDQHTMTLVEVDGVYVEPFEVDQLFIAVAQRYGVLVTAKTDKSSNFAIVAQMMTDMIDGSPVSPDDLDTSVSLLSYLRTRKEAWADRMGQYLDDCISRLRPYFGTTRYI